MILSFFRKNKRCTSKVVGRIIGVHETESTDDEGHYNGSSYEPGFSYEVNGQVYHGWGGRSYRAQSKIQIGGNIDIYYNPENPSDHYTKSSNRIVPVLIGFVFLCVGAGTAIVNLFCCESRLTADACRRPSDPWQVTSENSTDAGHIPETDIRLLRGGYRE